MKKTTTNRTVKFRRTIGFSEETEKKLIELRAYYNCSFDEAVARSIQFSHAQTKLENNYEEIKDIDLLVKTMILEFRFFKSETEKLFDDTDKKIESGLKKHRGYFSSVDKKITEANEKIKAIEESYMKKPGFLK